MDTINISNTCFFTGHRFIPGDSRAELRNKVKKLCIELITDKNVTHFITGGALGFDTLAALTIIELKEKYPEIKLHLYLPCTNQPEKWNAYDRKIWDSIKALADDYIYVTNSEYIAGCMQLRNKAMVDSSAYGIAYCTRNFGGTASTIKYAKEKNRNITVISDT